MLRKNISKITGLMLLILLVSGFTLYNNIQNQSHIMNPPIEYEDFNKDWSAVDSLIKKGLPKSAFQLTETIYQRAKETGNHPQYIKASLYKIRLMSEFEEEILEKTVADLKQEINQAEAPSKQIFHSILAEIYWQYYQMNRHKFYERTMISGFDKNDIRTWDLKTLLDEVILQYSLSLENPELLKATDLNDYNTILETEKDSKVLRPSLYDFLGHRAIDFYMNDESSIIQPAYRFEMNGDGDFSSPSDFIQIKYQTRDSLSLKYYALLIFQELTEFHLNDKDPSALIDLNLERLNFVHRNSILHQKDSLLLQSLVDFESLQIGHASSTEISFEIASALNHKSSSYDPLISEENRWDAKKAMEKCQEAMSRFPESNGAKKCENLMLSISSSSFGISVEKENYPDKPILSLLRYKNLNSVHLRMIKVNYSEYRNMNRDSRQKEELIKKYVGMTPVLEWVQELPNDGDYQEHKTEIKIPAFGLGHYLLLASESASFTPDSSTISYQTMWITRIGYVSQNLPGGGFGFYLMDREKGTALDKVNVKMFYRKYDSGSRSYQFIDAGEYISDEKGYFEIPPLADKERRNSFYLEFSIKDDQLVTGDRFYHSGNSPHRIKKRITTYLFTDRSIYRPGQTIYFKGIVLEKMGDKREIIPDHKTVVEFRDANHQKITELALETNEFGSIQGSFIIPKGLLNGRMQLRSESGSKSILVEEYKRPTFEVSFNPIEGSYKLNETVNLTGNVEAYAGNVISDAEVSYRVVREVYYPWRMHYFRHFPAHAAMEIKNGTTQTDDNGEFTIDFEAIPNYSIAEKYQPAFRYTVYTDVTDINSETQSGSTIVNVGSKALKIELDIGEVESRDKLSSIPIFTTNLNGQAIPAKGKVTISLLEEPQRLLREKLWKQPDVFVLEKESFVKDFPNDSYKDENDPKNLKTKLITSQIDFDTSIDSVLIPDQIAQWQTGRYKLEVSTADEYGTPVDLVKYFILFDEESKSPPMKELNWFYVIKNQSEPGETADFLIGTKAKKVRVLYEVIHKENIISSQWLTLSNEQKFIKIPVSEEFRGGFKVNLLFVIHNRVFKNSFGVEVPYTNKKLDFEFITFRDKLIPGEQEEWMIRIKNNKGDQVAAELLAGMYDESLDKFASHEWPFQILSYSFHGRDWNINGAFENTSSSKHFTRPTKSIMVHNQNYDRLNWFGFNYYGNNYYMRGSGIEGYSQMNAMPGQVQRLDGVKITESDEMMEDAGLSGDVEEKGITGGEPPMDTSAVVSSSGPQIRRDFKETAFFYPVLRTDENGDVIVRFKAPESLTRWKLMGLAHTKDLSYGSFTKQITTSKDLMIIPNAPRFFRQGDDMEFSAKIVNLASEVLTGEASIKFFHTSSMKEITEEVLTLNSVVPFSVEKGKSIPMSWNIRIPEKYDIISYQIMARAENHTDGEEKPIPVLSNRMLVTESMPLPVNGNETKDFTFKKLLHSSKDGSLINHKLTLEFSSNPAWYAVQALPYMMEESRESVDNIFHRFYANSIAVYIVNSHPKIKHVFDTWKNYSSDALISQLEKNEELKSLILNETPWVRDAMNETERKQRIALLFDFNKMADEQAVALRKLVQKQSPGGGWSWYKGMPDNRYMTQSIVSGFGHLKQLGVLDAMEQQETKSMLKKALRYLDGTVKEDYDDLVESKSKMSNNHLGNLHIQYLYARSYFIDEVDVSGSNKIAFDYFLGQAKQHWSSKGIYQKGMIALALHQFGETGISPQILASIKEYALYSQEMGMYWKNNIASYYWYAAPIETQALLIEAFDQVTNDQESVEKMKVWLLKQKQTQDWKTPRATAEAVYALLLRGSDWLASDKLAEITVASETLDPFAMEDSKVEAGTGYFKTSWSGEEILPEMGNIKVKNENSSIAWGGVYWQYFEDLDKITFAETPLKLDKKLFVKRNTDSGPVLEPIEEAKLNTGDFVTVRIELRVDRDMEYVHMKDMRASAFEPVNVLSGYRYQGGLGYYESTLDASTNFFFDYLRKGTYVFEYSLVAAQKGDFSNGITTIQCLYAPEFTSHSEGVRVIVE